MRKIDKSAWLDQCPDLTIGAAFNADAIPYEEKVLTGIADDMWDKGYLCEPPVFSTDETKPIFEALQTLAKKGIPPVYIYVFDQPWFLFARLNKLIGHFLGEEYALLPNLWAWYFDKPGERGWRPHHDCHLDTVFDIGGDQVLMSLSLWIPLMDVDEANGCMYVLPREKEFVLKDNPEMDQELLEPYATALPARSGSILGWPQNVVHWGGQFSEKALNPRASLSLEFQNTAFDPLVRPFLDASSPPPFEKRLGLIEGQYEKYKHIAAENETRYFSK